MFAFSEVLTLSILTAVFSSGLSWGIMRGQVAALKESVADLRADIRRVEDRVNAIPLSWKLGVLTDAVE